MASPFAEPVSSRSHSDGTTVGCNARDAGGETAISWRALLGKQFEDQRNHISGIVVNHLAAHEARVEQMLAEALALQPADSTKSLRRLNVAAVAPYHGSEGSTNLRLPLSISQNAALKLHNGSQSASRQLTPTARADARNSFEAFGKQQRRPVSSAAEASDGLHTAISVDHARQVQKMETISSARAEHSVTSAAQSVNPDAHSSTPAGHSLTFATQPQRQTTNNSFASSLTDAWSRALAHGRRLGFRRDDMHDYSSGKSSNPGLQYPPGSRARRAVERMEALDTLRRQSGSDLPRSKAPEERRNWRQRLQACTRDVRFELLIFCLILANVVMVGVEVQLSAVSASEGRRTGQDQEFHSDAFIVIDSSFTALFLVELALRVLSEGSAFFGSNQRWWNIFDSFVVLTSTVELALSNIVRGSRVNIKYLRFVRIIRVARILRAARLVRLVRFIRGLRMLVDSIFATLKSLLWALMLLLMILYGFALVMTQTVTRHIEDKGPEGVHQKLLEYWDTLPRSMFTLFKCVTGGVSWHDVVNPLQDVSPALVILLVLYISFTLFAVLNVMTGVFCQSAMDSAAQDKEMVAIYHMATHQRHAEMMRDLFKEIDDDHDGTVTLADFEAYLACEEVQAFFASLDIDADDAWVLYKLLDKDGQGVLDLQQFLDGCLSLRGSARAIQIAQLQQDNRWLMKLFQCCMEDMFDHLNRIHQELSKDDMSPSTVAPGAGAMSSIADSKSAHCEGSVNFSV